MGKTNQSSAVAETRVSQQAKDFWYGAACLLDGFPAKVLGRRSSCVARIQQNSGRRASIEVPWSQAIHVLAGDRKFYSAAEPEVYHRGDLRISMDVWPNGQGATAEVYHVGRDQKERFELSRECGVWRLDANEDLDRFLQFSIQVHDFIELAALAFSAWNALPAYWSDGR